MERSKKQQFKRTDGKRKGNNQRRKVFLSFPLISFPDNLSPCPSFARSNVLPEKEKYLKRHFVNKIFVDESTVSEVTFSNRKVVNEN